MRTKFVAFALASFVGLSYGRLNAPDFGLSKQKNVIDNEEYDLVSKTPTNTKENLRGLMVCPQDVQKCAGGTYVSRDPNNNCQFEPCPTTTTTAATEAQQISAVTTTTPTTTTSITPAALVCPQDVEMCDDGSYVSRDPNNNCQFEPCPTTTTTAATEAQQMSAVTTTTPTATTSITPAALVCPQDVQKCAGGTYVSRDPNNNCQFEPCPTTTTTAATAAPQISVVTSPVTTTTTTTTPVTTTTTTPVTTTTTPITTTTTTSTALTIQEATTCVDSTNTYYFAGVASTCAALDPDLCAVYAWRVIYCRCKCGLV